MHIAIGFASFLTFRECSVFANAVYIHFFSLFLNSETLLRLDHFYRLLKTQVMRFAKTILQGFSLQIQAKTKPKAQFYWN